MKWIFIFRITTQNRFKATVSLTVCISTLLIWGSKEKSHITNPRRKTDDLKWSALMYFWVFKMCVRGVKNFIGLLMSVLNVFKFGIIVCETLLSYLLCTSLNKGWFSDNTLKTCLHQILFPSTFTWLGLSLKALMFFSLTYVIYKWSCRGSRMISTVVFQNNIILKWVFRLWFNDLSLQGRFMFGTPNNNLSLFMDKHFNGNILKPPSPSGYLT